MWSVEHAINLCIHCTFRMELRIVKNYHNLYFILYLFFYLNGSNGKSCLHFIISYNGSCKLMFTSNSSSVNNAQIKLTLLVKIIHSIIVNCYRIRFNFQQQFYQIFTNIQISRKTNWRITLKIDQMTELWKINNN